jgi:hypothetical protein
MLKFGGLNPEEGSRMDPVRILDGIRLFQCDPQIGIALQFCCQQSLFRSEW